MNETYTADKSYLEKQYAKHGWTLRVYEITHTSTTKTVEYEAVLQLEHLPELTKSFPHNDRDQILLEMLPLYAIEKRQAK